MSLQTFSKEIIRALKIKYKFSELKPYATYHYTIIIIVYL